MSVSDTNLKKNVEFMYFYHLIYLTYIRLHVTFVFQVHYENGLFSALVSKE